MKKLPLTQGKFALVDDEDYEWLNQWKWQYSPSHSGKSGYAIRTDLKNNRKTLRMHRVILGITDDNIEVDHRNLNKLDNRKNNLRTANDYQQSLNRVVRRDSKSGIKGVKQDKDGKWIAFITNHGQYSYLGYFKHKKQAIKVRQEATLKYHGKFARL